MRLAKLETASSLRAAPRPGSGVSGVLVGLIRSPVFMSAYPARQMEHTRTYTRNPQKRTRLKKGSRVHVSKRTRVHCVSHRLHRTAPTMIRTVQHTPHRHNNCRTHLPCAKGVPCDSALVRMLLAPVLPRAHGVFVCTLRNRVEQVSNRQTRLSVSRKLPWTWMWLHNTRTC